MIPFQICKQIIERGSVVRYMPSSENDSVSEVSIIVGISVILVMRKEYFFVFFFLHVYKREKFLFKCHRRIH